ncbi:hypothetical protein G7Z17_g6281 [Cylindrodendrum hubeiense]|uniref:Uncharacterized protein n=1 Tax=Cylindrodendrum hubeiense TaxID=595255 RepID=A0A9P5H7L1_9HYPO|nr:hypothetical protein G7Z17_g6281 [Cylindrodendrum hubeiense]
MAPKGRGKAAKGPSPKRHTTQFGELDTTPTSRQLRSSKARKLATDEPAGGNIASSRPSGANIDASPVQPGSPPDEFDDGLDDVDLIKLDTTDQIQTVSQAQHFTWSEGESNPKRSSPLRAEVVSQSLWEFDEKDSMNPFSSPRSGFGKLPDTMPLPRDPTIDPQSQTQREVACRVDFSETASTMRRSSPLLPQDSIAGNWKFNTSSPQSGGLISHPTTQEPQSAHLNIPSSPPPHLPMDEIYDATPPGSRSQILNASSIRPEETVTHPKQRFHDPTPPQTLPRDELSERIPLKRKRKSMTELLVGDLDSDDEEPTPCPGKTKPVQHEGGLPQTTDISGRDLPDMHRASPTALQESTRGKKRKQRAKTPIQFDEDTNEIKEATRKKKTTAPPKPAIVPAPKNATQASISPVTNAKKRPVPKVASKPEPVKKKRKAAPRKEQHKKPATTNTRTVANVGRTRGAKLKEPKKPEMENKVQSQDSIPVDEDSGDSDLIYCAPDLIVISSDEHSSDLSEADALPPRRPAPPQNPRAKGQDLEVKGKGGSLSLKPDNSQTQPSAPKQSPPDRTIHTMSNTKALPSSTFEQDRRNAKAVQKTELSGLDKRTTRSMKKAATKVTGKATVLAPRDPNRATTRAQRSPQYKVLKKTRAVEWPEASLSWPPRKAGKISRSFSISEAGSPVPVGSDPAPFTTDSTPPDRERREHPTD